MRKTSKRSPRAFTRTIRSKKRVVAEWIFGVLSFLYFLFYWENNWIQTSRYDFADRRVPEALDGLKIVQVSDLHGKSFGRDNCRLLKRIRAERPDLIAVTGDLIDERSPFLEFARETICALSDIAPTFYVTGNHEGQFVEPFRAEAWEAVAEGGAFMADDALYAIVRNDRGVLEFSRLSNDPDTAPARPNDGAAEGTERPANAILLAGIPDPESIIASGLRDKQERYRKTKEVVSEHIRRLKDGLESNDKRLFVLLSHRPEQIETYDEERVDLVFSGHAHGGQFRIPGLLPNGLNAPHQGFFPKYTNGMIRKGKTVEIVSRGLGPSVIPTRFGNRPNLVVCTLHSR